MHHRKCFAKVEQSRGVVGSREPPKAFDIADSSSKPHGPPRLRPIPFGRQRVGGER
jgi:hypothetical protein